MTNNDNTKYTMNTARRLTLNNATVAAAARE